MSAPCRLLVFVGLLTTSAYGQFVAYQGGAAAETAWRNAVGVPIPMEQFESYNAICCPGGTSDQVMALPALGIVFTSSVPGAYPGVYTNASQAHSGTNQLANFGGGLGQFADYRMNPAPGRAIYALGFWQCDPQGDQTMYCFDSLGNLIGQITGLINNGSGNSFAAFTSTIPIARIDVEGLLGDGWNHIDDLQVWSHTACTADFNNDGTVDFFDYLDFVDAFSSGVLAADFNHDSVIDFFDYLDFVDAFSTGCP